MTPKIVRTVPTARSAFAIKEIGSRNYLKSKVVRWAK